ncbi:alpha-L-arabinofuranosidase C-terminal domain-containing protein [Paraflavitalea sp. CAU 1676]|uniref:alpha-L-arabinofuranosidase C-terminal domain-containing protein n=1 Tax=Paraflavitalea sp. CAU 1676 TaxID=3032598 RepID=UPI0023DB7DB3|nr:alpha-L-arabinofuranosidase C-terminal domain-containing protein [Paraflavitalea sp. CAU 1676]MDF2192608.1 alpha-L-arabinofuranosidase C-terminal domain-containing protein [Paraflavitalea sp. CAU 1676]
MSKLFSAIFLIAGLSTVAQEPITYTIRTSGFEKSIQPFLWGIFFEDINRGADGGLNADLVKNGSFEFNTPMMGWEPSRRRMPDGLCIVVNRQHQQPSNPKYLQVELLTAKDTFGLANEGFGGMAIKKGMRYDFSLLFRQATPGVTMRIQLLNTARKEIGAAKLIPQSSGVTWQTQSVSITAADTASKARLVIWFEGTGKLDLDMISLYPSDTWKGRPQGLRSDMVQSLADLQPGFVRFPGGCIVEGTDLNERYQWKHTIGPRVDRQLIINKWNHGVAARQTPDYYQSYALGFYEYFQMCEDIGAAPMPIINCGMSCQFNTSEVVPMDQLDTYIQDALDLIEFANGDANTIWGKKRADFGHPAPFNMKWLGVGNENWGPQYIERLQAFTKAIKEKYPEMQLITSTGYSPNPQFRYMDSVLRKLNVDIIDEHYYQTPNWFLMNAGKYDNYDRKGPKIFIGEYACHSVRIGSQDNKNTLLCALAEAAFMTGLERNADIVTMSAYAPLFAHTEAWQWTPNLIWFNNSQVVKTPSYYVQQLFSRNRGTHVLPLFQEGMPVTGQDSCYATAALDSVSKEVIIKLVNASGERKSRMVAFERLKSKSYVGTITTLEGVSFQQVNSLDQPDNVKPKTAPWKSKTPILLELPPYSLTVLRGKPH